MMLESEMTADLFGLAGTFPRPGWIVLDAARDHRFTGELVFDAGREVRVYFDRGVIYLAERAGDPSLGARLVDAGALNAVQLEHGSMRIGDSEHLGRLFERVPSVDRHTVLLTAELMNDECVAWLARQQVRHVTSAPYLHHPSGVHRWERPDDAVDLRPGDPLPAPGVGQVPVELVPPEPLFDPFSGDADALIQWDEPSWLDERPPGTESRASDESFEVATDRVADSVPGSESTPGTGLLDSDWVDRLESEGLPGRDSDPLAVPTPLPSVSAEPVDRFEIIWPSGEVDEEFGFSDAAGFTEDPEHDRVGPTARIARSTEPVVAAPDADDTADAFVASDAADQAAAAPIDAWDFEALDPYDEPESSAIAPPLSASLTVDLDALAAADLPDEAPIDAPIDDDVVLSMRRAVASIETGSLAARRRLAENTQTDGSSRGVVPVVPGRVAARTDTGLRAAAGTNVTPMRSVFDEIDTHDTPSPVDEPFASTESPTASPVVSEPAAGTLDDGVATVTELPTEPSVAIDAPADQPSEPGRLSALRRLIGGLRRR